VLAKCKNEENAGFIAQIGDLAVNLQAITYRCCKVKGWVSGVAHSNGTTNNYKHWGCSGFWRVGR